jgi:hypothetical protein
LSENSRRQQSRRAQEYELLHGTPPQRSVAMIEMSGRQGRLATARSNGSWLRLERRFRLNQTARISRKPRNTTVAVQDRMP